MFDDAILGRSEGTITSYLYKCSYFLTWLKKFNHRLVLPATDLTVAAYPSHLKNTSRSDSTVVSSAAAIKWIHGLMNITRNPVDSPLVQQVVSNAKRFLHNPPNQKLPLTLSQLKMVFDNLLRDESTLLELRNACYVCLKYALLFRIMS